MISNIFGFIMALMASFLIFTGFDAWQEQPHNRKKIKVLAAILTFVLYLLGLSIGART